MLSFKYNYDLYRTFQRKNENALARNLLSSLPTHYSLSGNPACVSYISDDSSVRAD